MTNEEMERRMEFFDKQQESFSDNLQQVSNKLHDLAERQDKFQDELDQLKARQDQAQAQQDQAQAQINSLNQALVGLFAITSNLAEAQKQTEARVNDLTESVKEVTERLDIFINVVERYIAENRNGKKSKSANPRPKRSGSSGQGRRKQS
jgi:chromosome segregation ATPase